jgi:acetate---CoA ligase (ADP-forming)
MITALASPRSIAVIGASTRVRGLAGRPLDYLKRYGFPGELYAVRPDGAPVLGVPAVCRVADLPGELDLAVIAVPAGAAVQAYADCLDHGVKAAVIVASGFDRGTRLERSLRRLAARGPTRLIGPNCVGFVNAHDLVYATVASSFLESPAVRGGVGLVTQSGGLGNAVVSALAARGLGISSWYSSGSEFDVGALEIIRSLIDDPRTRVITAFVEGLRDGQDLVSVGQHARQAGKPVLLLKGGLSRAGQRSALLHTGKASSGPAVWHDVAGQAGVSLVGSVEELVEAAAVALRLPPGPRASAGPRVSAGPRAPVGPRTVILSASGGLGVLLADRCQSLGVPLAELARPAEAAVAQALGLAGRIGNPVDIGAASDEQVTAAVEHLVGEPNVDAVLLAASRITSGDYQALGACLRQARDRVGDRLDRLVLSFLGPTDVATGGERDRLQPVTIVDSPSRALDALRHGWRTGPPAGRPRPAAAVLGRQATDARYDWAAIESLAAKYGLPLVSSTLARTEQTAVRAARDIGFPVVMKVVAPALWHRTDAGLVRVGVASAAAARAAFRELRAGSCDREIPDWEGVLVQPMVPGGLEVLVGVRWDAELGPILSVGLGGTAVEVLGEIHHRQLPVTRPDLTRLVRSGRLGVLLAGIRGAPALDEKGLIAAAEALARLYEAEPSVTEAEMNPLIVGPDGVHAVDVKLATT